MLKKITFSFIVILSITSTAYGMEEEKFELESDYYEQSYEINRVLKQTFDDALDRDLAFFITETEEEEPKPKPKIYVVKKGDNLYRISLNNDVKLDDLIEWNKLTTTVIHPGEKLLIYKDGEAPLNSKVDEPKTEPKTDKVIAQTKETDKNNVKNTVTKSNEQKVKNSKTNQPTNQPNVSLNSGEEPSAGVEMIVSATAYTAYCNGCSGTTAIGIDLRANPNQKVVAVDPKVIPLGSRVWVEGYGEAIAGDTGGAIKGNKIDVFIPSQEQAMQWGRKNVKIKILN